MFDQLMNYSIIYYRYYVLGIIQEYRFPPLHRSTEGISYDPRKSNCTIKPHQLVVLRMDVDHHHRFHTMYTNGSSSVRTVRPNNECWKQTPVCVDNFVIVVGWKIREDPFHHQLFFDACKCVLSRDAKTKLHVKDRPKID